MNQYKKAAKGSKLAACGHGPVTEYVKKASKMTDDEGYFDIIAESPNEKNHIVINQSSEEYYNMITSGSAPFIRHVAFFAGSIIAILGNF